MVTTFSDLMCHLEDTGIGVFWLHSAVVWWHVWWCGYFWGPWVSFFMADEFLVCVINITSRIGVSWTHSRSTLLFLTYVNLKFVSTIFYQFFIFSPNDSPLKTMKNVCYFIWKALSVLKRFDFLWFFTFLSTLSKCKWTNWSGVIYDVMNWHA